MKSLNATHPARPKNDSHKLEGSVQNTLVPQVLKSSRGHVPQVPLGGCAFAADDKLPENEEW